MLDVLLPVVGALVALWLVLVALLLAARPRGVDLRTALRLLPDLLRLVGRLARDRAVPRRARVALWLLIGYLALPIDLVPDVVPVIGWADDLLAVLLVLRLVVRTAGAQRLSEQWPGSADGLSLVRRAAGIR